MTGVAVGQSDRVVGVEAQSAVNSVRRARVNAEPGQTPTRHAITTRRSAVAQRYVGKLHGPEFREKLSGWSGSGLIVPIVIIKFA